jgi:excinuclease ABC subunit C
MENLAEQERFEEAAKTRDQIAAIKKLNIHSDLDLAKKENYDIFAIVKGENRGVVLRIFIRDGRVTSSSHSYFRHTEIFDMEEAYRQALLGFYKESVPLTSETILIAHKIDDMGEIAETLGKLRQKKLRIIHPRRGPKSRLAKLALKNAEELLKNSPHSGPDIESRIAELFSLESTPYRIEIFDNSHLMGEAPVGAMVVWDEGKWDKNSYRRYVLESRDEYAQMTEMLERRISDFENSPPPDLWLIDGGETLRRLAEKLLDKAGVRLTVLGISKEKLDSKAHRAKGAARDLLHSSTGMTNLSPSDPRLHWFQKLRDEAHRYAIAFHRKRKRRRDREISLMRERGIGPATVQKLLNYFGTFEAIEKASEEKLAEVTGKKTAKLIYGFYNSTADR